MAETCESVQSLSSRCFLTSISRWTGQVLLW